MPNHSVTYELTLKDCLDNKSTLLTDLVGQIVLEPLSYRYHENVDEADVSIEILDECVKLTRRARSITHMVFGLDERHPFRIADAQTSFEGQVETLKLHHHKGYLFIHYRLFVGDGLIAETEMELKAKVSDA